MRVVIAGGSGLLGRALARRLAGSGHDVVTLTRGSSRIHAEHRDEHWTPDGSTGPWAREIADADVVVNLAGAGIADKRWSTTRKAELRASRVDATNSLVSAIRSAGTRPSAFIQGSAVGYYGASLDERVCDENSPPGTDFLARLAVEWEDAARPAAELGCRVATIRTGIVLAGEGGALPPMARPFRFFVGGPVGTGRQFLSWITRDDWVSLATWAVETATVHGALNASAPSPVTNDTFSTALGRALHRPSWLRAPSMALRAVFGEMAEALLLSGQRVVPARTTSLGFRFEHTSIESALEYVLRD
jgi:uncharacterized protein (TIGR01777 family)